MNRALTNTCPRHPSVNTEGHRERARWNSTASAFQVGSEVVGHRLGYLVCLAVGAACSPVAPPVPHAAEGSYSVEQGHLLLSPVQDAEALLGRPVKVTADGAWSIADARLPSCEVVPRRQAARYRVQRRIQLQSLSSLAGQFSQLIGLDARYGAATDADIDIQNTAIMRADTRGECGDVFVDQVFIGYGSRQLVARADANVSASLANTPAGPAAGHDAHSQQIDALQWSEEHGYAFTFREAAVEDRGFFVNVDVPARVEDGDSVPLTIETTADAYVVVLSIDEAGNGAVLWPSDVEPKPLLNANQPTPLPSAAERAAGYEIRAQLAQPEAPARESLVVYAFRDAQVFEQLRPPVGNFEGDAAKSAAELTVRASSLPLNAWARRIASYVIVPRGQP